MSLPKLYAIGGALVALAIVSIAAYFVLQPTGDLLQNAGFSLDTISPNADGNDDIAVFSYTLSRNADVTMSLIGEDGQVFVFRDRESRIAGDYSVNFSGVVDGFALPDDEPIEGVVERRLLPNGRYSWTFEAEAHDDGEVMRQQGTLIIEDADTTLPRIQAFEVSSDVFSPNQDGVHDRIRVNVYLSKPAELVVYLQDDDGVKTYLAERLLGRDPGDEGNHEYDYDGGVDDGYEPPPDGEYALFAMAQDDEGQRIARQTTITLEDGGLPQVEITAQPVGGSVCFSAVPWDDNYASTAEAIGELVDMPEGSCSELTDLTMQQGDLLVFTLSVWNYGDTPVRTMGPFAGTVYQYDQLSSTLGYLEQDGTFRIGIHCTTAIDDHPWRWGLGDLSQLREEYDPIANDTFYYLDPGERAVVWGAIRMTEIFEEQNPQDCYASLIHEGVNIDAYQRGVGRRAIKLMPPPD